MRLEFAGALYHLTARGNAQADIFVDDADRSLFLDLLGKEITQQDWRCFAYCLMDNHYHLLIETPEANLAAGMRRFNGVYTQSFNRRHSRVGHLFQGRYKSIVVDKESYGLELCRYIVLNPVRARMVKHPEGWQWSSYRATVGKATAPEWLEVGWLLSQFSALDPAGSYERFVRQGLGQGSPWDKLRGQIWLGNEAFLQRMERLVQGKPVANVPRSQHRPARPAATVVTAQVLSAYGINDENALSSRAHQEAFQAWAYLLRRAANLPLSDVARRCKVSPSRISKIQRTMEQSKPSPVLQRLLDKCNVKN
jgi:putative transposase